MNETTTLQRFCMEEAKFRADEAGYELSNKELELLAEKFCEKSESWIDSEKLEEITEDFMKKQTVKEAVLICEVIPGEKYECPYCGTALTEEDMFAGHCKWCGQAIIVPEK